MKFESFASWPDLLAHIESGAVRSEGLWYHAPLDVLPYSVRVELRARGKVRVFPWSSADPFTADEGHLSRFRRRVLD
jgi:hypothetical protein